jgi:hypothetical protein
MTEEEKDKKSKAGSNNPPEASEPEPSEDYQRFAELAKRVLSVPKSEIDKRGSEIKRKRNS